MAYATGDNILDDHYNGFATSVNAVWGAGDGDSGYGQSSVVAAVDTSTSVSAAQWTTLLARVTSMKNQQGSSITAYADPQAGDVIQALTAIGTNIATITTNRLTTAATGSAISQAVSSSATFTGTITQTSTLTFAGGNESRYFFNSGGRVSASWAVSGGTSDPKYDNWAALATACGSYVIYGQTSGKSGGSGSTPQILPTPGIMILVLAPQLFSNKWKIHPLIQQVILNYLHIWDLQTAQTDLIIMVRL